MLKRYLDFKKRKKKGSFPKSTSRQFTDSQHFYTFHIQRFIARQSFLIVRLQMLIALTKQL